jgi:ADP-ribose pyrophosphatase
MSQSSKHWKTLERKSLLDVPPWLQVSRERVQLPSGRVIDDFYRVALPDFAVVVPVTPTGEVVLVRGYKHGLGASTYSPPAGLVADGEAPLDAARRELLEETGYVADDWLPLGSYVVDGNRQCGTMHLFLARHAHAQAVVRPDDSEDLDVYLVSRTDLLDMLQRGEFRSLAGASAIAITLALALEG